MCSVLQWNRSIWYYLWYYPLAHQIWRGVGRLFQLCEVQRTFKGECCWLSSQAPIDKYEHREEGMMLMIKAQEILFSTTDKIHLTPINAKDQVMLELVIPITLWTLLKQRCKWVFSNQTVHQVTILQEIWSEVVATLMIQYDDITGRIEWSRKTTISLHPTIVVVSLFWVNGPPHKMELSSPFWDLYITFLTVKFCS